jgi:hypothetical protein
MSYFFKNLDILSSKFPYLYLLMLSKLEKKDSKSKLAKIKLDLEHVDVLFIYKCLSNVSYSKIKKWLSKKDKKVIFFEDNLNNLYDFFHLKIANDFLKNESVVFYFFQNLKQLLDQIVSSIRSKNVKIITFAQKDEKYQSLKDEILQNCLISYYANHDRIYSYKIFKNFYSNLGALSSSFLINKFKNKFKNKPAIVLGAGPSLKYSFERLKKLQNRALIIAGGSAITCLSYENILPHFGVIIDPNFEEYKRMKDNLFFEIPMIYSTRVNKGVFKTFNGPLGYIKAGICGFFEVWLDKGLNISGKYIQNKHDEKALSVTTVSLMIAKMLGCNPIILDGVDLAFSQKKRYPLNIIKDNKLNDLEKDKYIFVSKDKNDKSVYTNLNWEIEKKWISSFAKDNKNIKFINATKNGLKIDNVIDMPLDEIEEEYFIDQFDYKSYIHFLSKQNRLNKIKKEDIQVLKLHLKKSFKKCKNYLQDIVKDFSDYKAILAKEEMSNEIAYKYFLFELEYTLNKFYQNSNNYPKLKEATDFFIKEFKE